MSDIKFILQADGTYDIGIEDGDLIADDSFETAILISLFTDARAPADKVVLPENRRGYLGDTVSPVEGRSLGGLMWLLNQRRLTQDTLNEAVDFARKSLNWFVEDGIAKSLDVIGKIVPRSGIAITATLTYSNGTTESHYVPLWEVTGVS